MSKIISCKYVLVGMILVFLSGTIGIAQSDVYTSLPKNDEFAASLQEFSKKLTTIQCDFTQVKKLQYLEVDLESSGKFWFQSPDKVRWEYQDPYHYIVLLNQGKLNLISDNNENEVDMRSNEIFEEINTLIISAVSGNIFNNPSYSVNAFENDRYYKIEMNPLSSSIAMMIEQMELYFDKKNLSVSKIKMIEPSSDYSLISFTNQQFNESLPEHIFIP
jgi:outer membrane lipoprotein-sorting protein